MVLHRTKLNAQDDRQFYQQPRIVKHVDDRFLAQVARSPMANRCCAVHALRMRRMLLQPQERTERCSVTVGFQQLATQSQE